MKHVLDELLDEFDIPGKLIRIKKLELDITEFNLNTSDKEGIKDNLHKVLKRQLSQQIEEALLGVNNDNIEIVPLANDALRLIKHLLEKGRIPWWAGNIEEVNLNKDLENLYKSDKDRLLIEIRKTLKNSFSRVRLSQNVNKEMLLKLTEDISDIGDDLKPFVNKLLSKVSDKDDWKFILDRLATDPDESSLMAALFDVNNVDIKSTLQTNPELHMMVGEIIQKMKSLDENIKLKLMKDLNIDEVVPVKTDQESNSQIQDFSTSNQDLIPIQNAGMVILHPFLKPFFQTLDLINGDAFENEAAQHVAAYLLHYIATGELDKPEEHMLVLNKVFCGIDIDEPIQEFEEFSDNFISESSELLSSVVENWPALKNTSEQGLREMFLKRSGSLRFESGAWVVNIEREATDVLIDKLPWGISMLKSPWSDKMIYVEW